MGEPARHVLSFDELYAQIERLSEHLTGEILEPGVLRTMSRPGASHQFASRRIMRSLGSFDEMEDGGGWWFEVEREIRFGELLAVPDLAGWRTDDVPDFVDQNPIRVAPDWCCEILSPSTARDDRQRKLPLYARSGVGWVWLVHPTERTVEVFEARAGLATLVATARDEDNVTLPPFGGSFDIGRYWKPPAKAAAEEP
jgi:Uma2 family endonuclease